MAHVEQAVLLPQLLHHVAQLPEKGQEMNVIVFGSPFYDDARSPAFSMKDGQIPSDGHFRHSRIDTPYGIDDPKALHNIRVHLGYKDNSVFMTDQHRNRMQRFWSLYLSQNAATLIRFTADIPMLLQNLNGAAPAQSYAPSDTDKLEMIQLRPSEVSQTIYERALSQVALTPAQISRATQVEIGITWDCQACDLDLYARPHPQAAILFFGNTATPEGMHLKDYRNAPENHTGFETIVFNDTVNLHDLAIVINHYSGATDQVINGTIRLAAHGHVYVRPFTLTAGEGNGAINIKNILASGTPRYEGSVVVDPLSLVSI